MQVESAGFYRRLKAFQRFPVIVTGEFAFEFGGMRMKGVCRFLRFLVAIGSMSGRNVREKLLHLHGLQFHVCRHQGHGQAYLICGVG